METYDHIRKISLIFFTILGLVHFLAGMAFVRDILLPQSGLVNRVTFIPFVVAGFTHGFAQVKYRLLSLGNTSRAVTIGGITVGVLLFAALVAGELLVVDSAKPLIGLIQ